MVESYDPVALMLQFSERGSKSDSWQNATLGYGTVRDKTVGTTFCPGARLDEQLLEDLYHNDDISRRACEKLPDEAMRQGFKVKLENADQAKAIEKACRAFDVRGLVATGGTWARAYGGGGIFMGCDDGQQDQSEPLDLTRIKSVRFMMPIEKRYLRPESWYEDANDPKFGEVKVFRVFQPTVGQGNSVLPGSLVATTLLLHESRLIQFRGARTGIIRRRQNLSWDDSVIQAMWDTLRMFATNWQSVNQLMSDASQGVMKIKGLMQMIGSGNGAPLLTRMALTDQQRSAGRMLMVDADGEDFTRVPSQFTGIPELIRETSVRLAAAADMPVTKLFGIAPAGLNATGDADTRSWYDTVKGYRENYLTPRLERIVTILTAAQDGPTGGQVIEDPEIVFPSLWQLSPTEEATMRYTHAQADKIYFDCSAVTPEEIARTLVARGLPSELVVDLDARAELLTTEAIKEELMTPEPDPNAPPTPGDPKAPAKGLPSKAPGARPAAP